MPGRDVIFPLMSLYSWRFCAVHPPGPVSYTHLFQKYICPAGIRILTWKKTGVLNASWKPFPESPFFTKRSQAAMTGIILIKPCKIALTDFVGNDILYRYAAQWGLQVSDLSEHRNWRVMIIGCLLYTSRGCLWKRIRFPGLWDRPLHWGDAYHRMEAPVHSPKERAETYRR